MKSYRVRMTEGVEMTVRFDEAEKVAGLVDLLEMALGDDMFLRTELDGTSGESVAINPRHVLYVREVAE